MTPTGIAGAGRVACMVRTVSTAAVVFFAVTATATAAPSVEVDRACYAHLAGRGSEPVTAVVNGGTPGADFTLLARGRSGQVVGSATGTFDAAGVGQTQILGIRPPSGTTRPSKGEPVTFAVQDRGTGAETPSGSALVTTIAMSISSKPRNPRLARVIKVSGGGVFAGKTLNGFVTKPGSGKVLRKIRIGKASQCGYVSTKQVVAPRGAGTGQFQLHVNAGPRLDKANALSFSFRIFRF